MRGCRWHRSTCAVAFATTVASRSRFSLPAVFSRRTDWGDELDPFYAFASAAAVQCHDMVDLTVTNPTKVGLATPVTLIRALQAVGASSYEPAPLGLPAARRAVAGYYHSRGYECTAARVCLSASTSEAYAHLFAVVCDPGDVVLVPSPGYPLFEFIGDIMGVHIESYSLEYDGAWHVSMPSVREALLRCRADGRRVGAIVAVAPSNPLGCYLRVADAAQLQGVCSAANAALIVDEVFADYPIDPPADALYSCVGWARCLTFVVSGLSKTAALPQCKLAWTVVQGPDGLVGAAIERLARVADTFLSVASPVQLALPSLFAGLPVVQEELRGRLHQNWRLASTRFRSTAVSVLRCEGGWSVILRLPQAHPRLDRFDDVVAGDVAWAQSLLEVDAVLTQPGSAFGLLGAHLVLSMLTPPSLWAEGLGRILAAVG